MTAGQVERVLKSIQDTTLIEIPDNVTYTLGGGGIDKFLEDQKSTIVQKAQQVAQVTLLHLLPPKV